MIYITVLPEHQQLLYIKLVLKNISEALIIICNIKIPILIPFRNLLVLVVS
jgi:hypothetical protein